MIAWSALPDSVDSINYIYIYIYTNIYIYIYKLYIYIYMYVIYIYIFFDLNCADELSKSKTATCCSLNYI